MQHEDRLTGVDGVQEDWRSGFGRPNVSIGAKFFESACVSHSRGGGAY